MTERVLRTIPHSDFRIPHYKGSTDAGGTFDLKTHEYKDD